MQPTSRRPLAAPLSLTMPPHPLSALEQSICSAISEAGGWIGFDRFMELALYTPGLGYYAHDSLKFGPLPGRDGSDFVTAPEISPLFGYALAKQVAQALTHTGTTEIWEFGAGSGALAEQLLRALAQMGVRLTRYTIVDVSAALTQRQQQRLARFGDLVHWAQTWPAQIDGVVLGNEVLDAMPVQLLARCQGAWFERGVCIAAAATNQPAAKQPVFAWQDSPTALRLPLEPEGAHDYLSEIHPQAQAFVRSLAERLRSGCAFFLDYGFGEGEYYHPQRAGGTVMCHRAHQSDSDPLTLVGEKDITAHVNFSGIALTAQDAGLQVLGYTSQAHFLINCGIVDLMQAASLPVRAAAQTLILEHEMGELFKVLALGPSAPWTPLGFARGDRLHRL
ncbi:MAG: SAM-dependent methyltransferase [Rhodoferax sp.]|nr:SAM-dependent methyltransferase [Rhodoferax sp.]